MNAKNQLFFSEQDLHNRMTALYAECENLESYILDLRETLEKTLQKGTEPQVLHQQYVLFRNLMGAHEKAGRKYAEYIHNKDAQIAILKASYEELIQSSWWKKTEKMRYVEEVLQKHLLHTKTMSQTLAEIAADRGESVVSDGISEEICVDLPAGNMTEKVHIVVPVTINEENIKNLLAALKGQRVEGELVITVMASAENVCVKDICDYMNVNFHPIDDVNFVDAYIQEQLVHDEGERYVVVMPNEKPTDVSWLKRKIG